MTLVRIPQQVADLKQTLHCDNAAVVHMPYSGRGRDQFLLTVALNIWLITSTFDIMLKVYHMAGKINVIVDLLYRWYNPV